MDDNNHLQAFVNNCLQKTDDKADYIQIKTLFNEFNTEYSDYQRDKRTKLDRRSFEKQIIKTIGEQYFKETYFPCRGTCVRTCFVGWRKNNGDEF